MIVWRNSRVFLTSVKWNSRQNDEYQFIPWAFGVFFQRNSQLLFCEQSTNFAGFSRDCFTKFVIRRFWQKITRGILLIHGRIFVTDQCSFFLCFSRHCKLIKKPPPTHPHPHQKVEICGKVTSLFNAYFKIMGNRKKKKSGKYHGIMEENLRKLQIW